MKRTWTFISMAALIALPFGAYADHDKNCTGTHGTVSAVNGDSITVKGTTYTLDSGASISSEGSTAAVTKSDLHVGDKVCLQTDAANGKQVSKVMVLDRDASVGTRSDVAAKGYEKMNEVERKAHEKMCQGHHGTVTDKTASTVSIDGKSYALAVNTPVNKQEEALLPKTMKVGDRVCYVTKDAADGTKQITKLMAVDQDADAKIRVREKTDTDADVKVKTSDDGVKIETKDKKVEVK